MRRSLHLLRRMRQGRLIYLIRISCIYFLYRIRLGELHLGNRFLLFRSSFRLNHFLSRLLAGLLFLYSCFCLLLCRMRPSHCTHGRLGIVLPLHLYLSYRALILFGGLVPIFLVRRGCPALPARDISCAGLPDALPCQSGPHSCRFRPWPSAG